MNIVTFSSIPNNADWFVSCTYTAANGTTPIDLTGSTLSMQVRLTPSDPVIAVPVTVAVTNAALGLFTVSVSMALLAAVELGTYGHDLVRTKLDGTREQIWTGTLTIVGGYTR